MKETPPHDARFDVVDIPTTGPDKGKVTKIWETAIPWKDAQRRKNEIAATKQSRVVTVVKSSGIETTIANTAGPLTKLELQLLSDHLDKVSGGEVTLRKDLVERLVAMAQLFGSRIVARTDATTDLAHARTSALAAARTAAAAANAKALEAAYGQAQRPDHGGGMAGHDTDSDDRKLTFVVGGHDYVRAFPPDMKLFDAIRTVLAETNHTGRPLTDWEVRSEDGRFITPDATVAALPAYVYLTTAIGAGGADSVEAKMAAGDHIGALCDVVKESGGEMKLYGQPVSEAEFREHVSGIVDAKLAACAEAGIDPTATAREP